MIRVCGLLSKIYYRKVILTKQPLISNTMEEIVDSFDALGNVLFEEEFTEILNNFIERKMRFVPMFLIMHYYPFDKSYIINMYEDIEQKKLFKTLSLQNIDFIVTGMTVNSLEDKYELIKLVTYNKNENKRDIYVVGFINYQLEKWK